MTKSMCWCTLRAVAHVPAAERRRGFVDAAIKVIAGHGVDGATTRRIAEQAEAPLASLHYCFASKEVLFAAVFEHLAERYRDLVLASDAHGDLRTTARGLLEGVATWYVEQPEVAVSTVELVSWAQRHDRTGAVRVYDAAYGALHEVLTAAADGTVEPEVVEEVAYAVGALSDGFVLGWMTYRDLEQAQGQLQVLLGVLDAWLEARLAGSSAATA
jgi:AcrR family transcriptional regulator